jgi:xanthine dehydrogenase YagS FAD-binding subunit
MKPFTYERATDEDRALSSGHLAGVQYIAGRTTLLDLMRLEVMRPAVLCDITRLPLAAIEPLGNGVRIGAMARNTEVAYHPLITDRYPALSQALLSGASVQIRNMATVGGNLLQRTRCPYFRDLGSSCNKRDPGSGCSALDGYTRMHAVLGVSEHCIAAHPSDMCVALVALDASLHIRGPAGSRALPLRDFYTLPGDHPEVENMLQRGELITHIELPASDFAARSAYVKVRDRASYAFALASAAVALDLNAGRIRAARVALGGVGTRPWRSSEAEEVLTGQAPALSTFQRAAAAALVGARPRKDNQFKIELARRTLVRGLSQVAQVATKGGGR